MCIHTSGFYRAHYPGGKAPQVYSEAQTELKYF